MKQKLISFCNNQDNVQAMLELIKMVSPQGALIGDSDFKTIVNAVAFDTRSQLILDLIEKIQFIKEGGLNQVEQ